MKRVALAAAAKRVALAAAALAVAALHLSTRAHSPQGWDEIGFLRAVDHFDLARFQPHFPGYPVYVALCKLVRVPSLVSAIASGATALALARVARSWWAIALWGAAFTPWLVGAAPLADMTAVAFAAGAIAALTYDGARARVAGGVAIGLMLGTRISYWPIALSWLALARHRPSWRHALAAVAAGTIAWLVPFVAVVGARTLWALGRVHVAGHFGDWGGSIATEPHVGARVVAFVRDLVYDGIWPSAWALAAAAVVAAIVVARAPSPSRPARRVAAIVVVPYALWALFAQNVVAQPRHLLPLVAALVVALARGCARRPLLGAALAALALASSAPLVIRRGEPAAAVVAHRVVGEYGRDVVVFGRRSARLMQFAEPSLHVETRDAASDVLGALERFSVLPHHIFVTDELADDEPSRLSAAHESLRFCRDLRVDRQSPCVALRSYNLQP